ncbi:MAG: hypothetical protein AVDCRST_MAG88-205, partial [uncultured Thermomicrobiales bacterium]
AQASADGRDAAGHPVAQGGVAQAAGVPVRGGWDRCLRCGPGARGADPRRVRRLPEGAGHAVAHGRSRLM